MIKGIGILATDMIIPIKIPRIIGLVAMPFKDFFNPALSSPVLPGAVNDSIMTAATLYKGTVARIISGAIALEP